MVLLLQVNGQKSLKQSKINKKYEVVSLFVEKDVQKIKEDADKQIKVEKDKAISEIREEVVNLSILVAEKIIQKNLSNEENQILINESLKNLKEYEA